MTPRFNASTRSYRAARQVRFLIRCSIAGVVAVAVALWIGGRL
jgi:hypothetical protein